MNALLQTVGLYCCCLGHYFGISVSGKGGIRLRLKKNLLPRSDGPLSSSELGEYTTYGSFRVRSTNFLLNLRDPTPISMKFGTLGDYA